VSAWGGGVTSVGFIVAGSFLVIGCFIDAIPAIIILGTILAPLADSVGMHPIHFAIIGVMSIAFGLVTPPYGLCLLIACALGKVTIREVIKDVLVLLMPMLAILTFVILFPEVILALPRCRGRCPGRHSRKCATRFTATMCWCFGRSRSNPGRISISPANSARPSRMCSTSSITPSTRTS
jgi:hypothetical protein